MANSTIQALVAGVIFQTVNRLPEPLRQNKLCQLPIELQSGVT